MFTGIIQGNILATKVLASVTDLTFSINCKNHLQLKNAKIGDSIAFDGVCLTVARLEGGLAHFELMKESLDRTSFQNFPNQKWLNFETSLTLEQKLDGHIVYGEVDCCGEVVAIENVGNAKVYQIKYPAQYAKYVVDKGRVTVDGASLSVTNSQRDGFFKIFFIPHTLKVLTIGDKRIGEKVNLEFDIYAKLVYKQRKSYES